MPENKISNSGVKDVNVFVVLGALQVIAVEQIRKSMPSGSRNICINISTLSIDLPDMDELITISSNSLLKVVIEYRKLIRKLKQLRQSSRQFNVFIPHPYHSISNYLAFHCKPTQLNLLPDGLINYFYSRISASQYRKMLARKLMKFVGGPSYTPYRGSLVEPDLIHYHKLYMFSKESLVTKTGKLHLLTLPGSSKNTDKEPTTLVVDQPLENLGPKACSRIKTALDRYLAKESGPLIYKPHRTQKKINICLDDTSKSIRLLPGNEPVEYLAKRESVGKIIGIYSSALFTLRLMNPHVPCISIGLNLVTGERPECSSLLHLFQKYNIQCIDA